MARKDILPCPVEHVISKLDDPEAIVLAFQYFYLLRKEVDEKIGIIRE